MNLCLRIHSFSDSFLLAFLTYIIVQFESLEIMQPKALEKIPVDAEEAKELVSSLRSIPENRNCFDCGQRAPSWCSVNNAVFLCISCCSRHRGMGVHLSFMRSVDLDDWTPIQSITMALGGNGRARSFFKQHGLEDMKNVYATPSAVKYRSLLDQNVKEIFRSASPQGILNERKDAQVPFPCNISETSSYNRNSSLSDCKPTGPATRSIGECSSVSGSPVEVVPLLSNPTCGVKKNSSKRSTKKGLGAVSVLDSSHHVEAKLNDIPGERL